MNESIHGSCLCGQVQYRVTGPFEVFHLCHCSQCRRATGTAHAANIFTTADRIEWLSGQDLIKRYTPAEAGIISKCFCSNCGSTVPYTSLKSGKLIIPAGGLNEAAGIAPKDNIFWRDRADWYDAGVAAEHVEQFPD